MATAGTTTPSSSSSSSLPIFFPSQPCVYLGSFFCCLTLTFILYRVVYFTGTPQFQYQQEKHESANHSCCSSKSC